MTHPKRVTACCRADTVCYPETPYVEFCEACGHALSPALHRRGIDQIIWID
jgi:hypothetical protein